MLMVKFWKNSFKSDWNHSLLTNDSTTRVSLNTSEWEKEVSADSPLDLTQPSISTANSSITIIRQDPICPLSAIRTALQTLKTTSPPTQTENNARKLLIRKYGAGMTEEKALQQLIEEEATTKTRTHRAATSAIKSTPVKKSRKNLNKGIVEEILSVTVLTIPVAYFRTREC
ncbi:unnamed protein product [Didymodactylos carnosus]|uniref:Uncharacterized protein n=1 Tax=Didymodactylos carnosus TaxID=1234261 RepID=A0A8S2CT31_9BILA|nr:unnamed protein product [Didymodactylos carnosus]CAF3579871.1 unnamed protein product [Didymodactylos carnosus]